MYLELSFQRTLLYLRYRSKKPVHILVSLARKISEIWFPVKILSPQSRVRVYVKATARLDDIPYASMA